MVPISQLKLIAGLLKKTGIGSTALTQGELEDISIGKLMHGVDKTKKVRRPEMN